MGTSSAAVLERVDHTAGSSDHQLVSAVRRGDDRAFEQLYARYQRRIAAYVCGMVKDYGRAEDITQEVFVSALRRMRQTERPIAFKPWIYEIAKNACIDAYRRSRRAEEISFDADDRLSPSDQGRLVAAGPTPDAAVDTKQDLDHLCGAFGGLSESHHQILVMRELEGLSYKQIGDRMGMSRPAVESTLFRARKRLGEEYDELASGARCLRIQAIIADAGGAELGLRDQRKLSRHLSHCQACRRVAALAGLEISVPARRRVAEKIAAWLPLPAFLRLRRGGDELMPLGGGGGWMAQIPSVAEPMSSGWSKAAAGLAALVVAGAGVGVSTGAAGNKRDERGTGFRPAAERRLDAPAAAAPARAVTRPAADPPAVRVGRGGGVARRGGGTVGSGGAAGAAGGGQPTEQAPGASPDSHGGVGGGGGAQAPRVPEVGAPAPAANAPELPTVDVPAAVNGGQAAQDVTDTVQSVEETAQDAVDAVQATGSDPANVVPNVQQTVNDVAAGAGEVVDGASTTVGGLLNP
jgi:RNA polymerase sigma factor (sigma-70 family)